LGATAGTPPRFTRSPRRPVRAARTGRRARRLGSLEVDNKLELGGRLYRKVARLLALEDAVDVGGRTPERVNRVSPIGDQAPPRRRRSGRDKSPAAGIAPPAR